MKMKDALSIVENTVRCNIIMRLDEAGKAAYSDLLDAAGIVGILDSRGNFNYHLNFLLQNSIVIKNGLTYRLTDKGQAIAQFVKEVNLNWKQIEPKLRGDYVSILNCAEEFEKETGIKMQKTTAKRKLKERIEIITDEKSVICLLDEEKCKDEFFKNYEEIQTEDLRLQVKEATCKNEKHNLYIFGLPDLTYHLSPYYLGSVLQYLQTNFDEAHLFADKNQPMPFLLRAKKLQERYEGPAFMIAPVILE